MAPARTSTDRGPAPECQQHGRVRLPPPGISLLSCGDAFLSYPGRTVGDESIAHDLGAVVIAHKDRLARFGYDYLAHEASTAGCELLVANQESLSPQREMVADLLAIVHVLVAPRWAATIREDVEIRRLNQW
jgi:hypothetical protein